MTDVEREIRAARNQALFRAVNETIRDINEAFASITNELTIACECADATCVQTLSINPSDYAAVRESPRRFVVLPGHVVPGVERAVSETEAYVVVEKLGEAAQLVERLDLEQ